MHPFTAEVMNMTSLTNSHDRDWPRGVPRRGPGASSQELFWLLVAIVFTIAISWSFWFEATH